MYKPFIVASLLAATLFSCKKETTTETENVNLFYRLVSKDFDEQMAYSKVIVAKATVELKSSTNNITTEQLSTDGGGNQGGGSGNDGDEGHSQNHFENDGCNTNTPGFCQKHPWHKKCISLLPMKLEYINAQSEGNRVTITWKVSLEDNVEKYMIERSKDGIDFITVAEVKPTGIATNYKYIDVVK